MKQKILLLMLGCFGLWSNLHSQTIVNSLATFRTVIADSNQHIILTAGAYNLNDSIIGATVITFSGSNNTIDLRGVHIEVPVGSINEGYIIVTGSNNTIIGGVIEDTYNNGLTEITDFSAYNQDRANLAFGLRGDPVMTIFGDDNLVDGLKLTVRGSYPYGYGSMYGIGSGNAFGLNKRCGILIKGENNTLDHVEVQQRAFGHAIFTQPPANNTTIKNCYVEGSVRPAADIYNEINAYDLPFRSDYKMPFDVAGAKYDTPVPIPTDQVFTLMEDGIRVYNNGGSIRVENCTVKKARGGIRLYFSPDAKVSNSTAVDCGSTNFNLPAGGTITGSTANFAYAPVSDFRTSKSNQNIEITILPSPHATGPHNMVDVQGNNHNIVFHRTPGPVDTTDRAIVVTGENSTILNETEYPIILESTTRRNAIKACAGVRVTNKGIANTVTYFDCEGISITSSESNFLEGKIDIYPNPVTDKLTVSFKNTKIGSNAKITLHDIYGQKLLEVSSKDNSDSILDLSNLQSGVYFLEIRNNSKKITKKILKI